MEEQLKSLDLNQTNKSLTTINTGGPQPPKVKKKLTKKLREAQSMVNQQRKKAEDSIEHHYNSIEDHCHKHQISADQT